MRFIAPLAFALVATGLSVVACSSSSDDASASGCASDPFSCPAGQTCAAKDTSGAFACIPSGSGAKGSSCLNTPGVTSCGDGLTCLQLSAAGGTCNSYCAPGTTHVCGTGETCQQAALQGTTTTFFVCTGGVAPTPDAGGSDAAATD